MTTLDGGQSPQAGAFPGRASDREIRSVGAEFFAKARPSCSKCVGFSREVRSIFSSIFNLEKICRFGLVEIENRACNGGTGKNRGWKMEDRG